MHRNAFLQKGSYMNKRLLLLSGLRHLYWVWAQSGRESSWFQRMGVGSEVIFYFKDCTDGWISLLMRPLQAEQRKQMGALQPRVFCTVQTCLSFTNKGSVEAGDFFNQIFISVVLMRWFWIFTAIILFVQEEKCMSYNKDTTCSFSSTLKENLFIYKNNYTHYDIIYLTKTQFF